MSPFLVVFSTSYVEWNSLKLGALLGVLHFSLGVCITIFDSQLSLFVEGHFSSYLQNKKT